MTHFEPNASSVLTVFGSRVGSVRFNQFLSNNWASYKLLAQYNLLVSFFSNFFFSIFLAFDLAILLTHYFLFFYPNLWSKIMITYYLNDYDVLLVVFCSFIHLGILHNHLMSTFVDFFLSP
jgi:hypothetical protein